MSTTVRLPLRVEEALAEYCVGTRRTKSEVIVETLEQRFFATAEEKSPYALAQDAGFIGCVDLGEAADANTKARVAAAIRAKHGRS